MDRPGVVARLRADLTGFAASRLPEARGWCVGLSGGPDSLALVATAAAVLPTTALIVDHGLQHDSESVAEVAREQAMQLGCVDAQILRVHVGAAGGPEAAARTARYAALDVARSGEVVLLGHTLDDQAETVLLGLGRGSGARSIAGMQSCDPPWYRPFLGVRRSDTHQVCADLRLTPWLDPHNRDRRFTRVRLREEVLPLLEDVLGGGVAAALARTAASLREDTAALDAAAAAQGALAQTDEGLDLALIDSLYPAVRRRVIRGWLHGVGAVGLTDKQIRAIDALVTSWRGQGAVAVGSEMKGRRLFAGRRNAMLVTYSEPV